MVTVVVSGMPAFPLDLDASGYIEAARKSLRETAALIERLEPNGKRRKTKPNPKPVDPVWLKKRKKLLAKAKRK